MKKPTSTGAALPENIGEMYPKAHLRNIDLRGKAHNVTIRAIDQYMLYDYKEKEERAKWVLYFEGKNKYLILKETIAKTIIEILGKSRMADWIGGEICIYPERVTVAKKVHETIRVRAPEKKMHSPNPSRQPKPPTKAADPTATDSPVNKHPGGRS